MIKLKSLFLVFIFGVVSIFMETSCSKRAEDPNEQGIIIQKKIQFILYTTADYSEDDTNISFSVSIQNLQNQVLWDSTLAPMKIKDIPDLEHQLSIEKIFADNGNAILKVGFTYSIENVGYSWFYDSCGATTNFKQVDFNFQ